MYYHKAAPYYPLGPYQKAARRSRAIEIYYAVDLWNLVVRNKRHISHSHFRGLDVFHSNRSYTHRDQQDIATAVEQGPALVQVQVLEQVVELALGSDKFSEEVGELQWPLKVAVAYPDQLVHYRVSRLLWGPLTLGLVVPEEVGPFETDLAWSYFFQVAQSRFEMAR